MNSIWLNPLVTAVCSSLLFFLLKNAIPSYFSKKGENLATKQDIGEITQKVEGAKDEFIRGIERLKTELQFANSVKLSIKNETRSALVDCYEKYSLWIRLLSDDRFSRYNEDNIDAISIHLQSFDEAYFNLLVAESKAELYGGFADNLTKWADMKKAGINLQYFISGMYLEYKLIINKCLNALPAANLVGYEAETKLISDSGRDRLEYRKQKREEFFSLYGEVVRQMAEWQPIILKKITALDE